MIGLTDIFTLERLEEAVAGLKKKGFKPGIDGMSAEAATLWLQINGGRLLKDLYEGRYMPMPAMGFAVAKMNGEYPQLAKLTALDSALQQCLLSSLTEHC